MLIDEAVVAESRGQCRGREPAGWHFIAQLQGRDAPVQQYDIHVWISDDGEPQQASYRTPQTVVSFSWRDGQLIKSEHGDTSRLPQAQGVWVVPSHAVWLRELMFRLAVGVRSDVVVHRTYSPDLETLTELRFGLSRDGQQLVATANPGTYVLTGSHPTPDAAPSLAMSTIAGLHLPSGATLYHRTNRTNRTNWVTDLPEVPRPVYQRPNDINIEPIAITSSTPNIAPSLAAELVLPRSTDPDPTPRQPAVLWLNTGGVQDRYGFVPGTSIDTGAHAFHDALVRAGFIVLRYDDREITNDHSQQDDVAFTQRFADANDALRFLIEDPRVDPLRVLLAGHGEGAIIAIELANAMLADRSHPKPIGIVLLAMAGRPLRVIIEDQMVRDANADRENVKQRHNAIERGEVPVGLSPAQASYLRELFKLDPIDSLASIAAPIIALQGGKDFQIDPVSDFGPVRAIVENERRSSPHNQALLFADLDHLLKHETGRSTIGHYGDLSRHVDQRAVQAVVAWAKTVAKIP